MNKSGMSTKDRRHRAQLAQEAWMRRERPIYIEHWKYIDLLLKTREEEGLNAAIAMIVARGRRQK